MSFRFFVIFFVILRKSSSNLLRISLQLSATRAAPIFSVFLYSLPQVISYFRQSKGLSSYCILTTQPLFLSRVIAQAFSLLAYTLLSFPLPPKGYLIPYFSRPLSQAIPAQISLSFLQAYVSLPLLSGYSRFYRSLFAITGNIGYSRAFVVKLYRQQQGLSNYRLVLIDLVIYQYVQQHFVNVYYLSCFF